MGIDILSALAPLPGFGPKNFGYFAEGSSNAREIPIFGSEGVVSEVLNGKRPLNSRHILRLSERFNISPAVFYPQIAR